jgi:hypothetical protein
VVKNCNLLLGWASIPIGRFVGHKLKMLDAFADCANCHAYDKRLMEMVERGGQDRVIWCTFNANDFKKCSLWGGRPMKPFKEVKR